MKKKIKSVYHVLRDLGYCFLYIGAGIAGIICRILFPYYRHAWIITELGEEARDNGYWMYRYITRTHPEINCFYIINTKSPDYDKVKDLGMVVPFKSFRHWMLFATADYKISTHIMGYAPKLLPYYRLDKKYGLVKGKKIFLQHGIIKDQYYWGYHENAKLDLFVCGARPEYDFIKKESGYPEGVVQYTGLCRYDDLRTEHPVKRQILVMPTWRNYAVNDKTEKEFIKTAYYMAYQSLINSEALGNRLDEWGYKLVFYPHQAVQKFIHCFYTPYENVITIASRENYDVHQLLMESALLITDFSSVFFDFAYMHKPIIYYQFDRNEYREAQYEEGYFIYERDGFGPVVSTEEELMQKLLEICNDNENKMTLDEKYRKRLESFFVYQDLENCKRNFDAIYRLKKSIDKE